MKRLFQLSILISVFVNMGCASLGHKLKALVSGKPDEYSASRAPASVDDDGKPRPVSFSAQSNLNPVHERKYKRVTKENFGDEQMLQDNAGSLWRREGQGSYLFSQNNLRQIGDIINVEVEGKAATNLTSKLSVIKTNLARLEPPIYVQRAPAAQPGVPRPDGQLGGPKPDGANSQNNQNGQNLNADKNSDSAREAEREKVKEDLAKFDTVPCRITDKNTDGSYRVKGQTSVYVGRHEYRLIVTGLVRPEDVTSELVTSTKMLDPKFDLVATSKEIR